jgi:diguanylate cyclase (GGDEF)-like protein
VPTLREINRDLENRVKELALINELSQYVASCLELSEFYDALDRFLGEKVGLEEFALLIREGDGVIVQVARGFADTSKVRGARFKTGEGVTGAVLESKQLCYIPDTRADQRYLYYKGEKMEDGSFLCIPLIFRGQVVGILNFTRTGFNAFSPQEIQFLNTIAVEIAIALANARLYYQTRELSVRDELTQLYNRRHFRETFPLEIKRAGRFGQTLSLLMIDIDHFKHFNDTHGHLEGDKRLQEIAQAIRSNLREVDFTARFGGEEFVVLLPNTSKQDALIVAEKVRRVCTALPGERLTLSVGIATCPQDGNKVDNLLQAADQALYEAKWEGRDRAVAYDPSRPSQSPVPLSL